MSGVASLGRMVGKYSPTTVVEPQAFPEPDTECGPTLPRLLSGALLNAVRMTSKLGTDSSNTVNPHSPMRVLLSLTLFPNDGRFVNLLAAVVNGSTP